MKKFGIKVPEILFPKTIDTKTWAVVACDQYTQDRDYWKKAEEIAGNNPSTLNLILPEVYLNDADKPERIQKIRQNMKNYLENGVFAPAKKAMIYLERTTAYGRVRKGLMAEIDLDTYEWKPFTTANIRATEATIVARIPPRMEIRRGAPVELPHIMLLVNDKEGLLVEGAGKTAKASGKSPVYDGELMMNSGSIQGWALESDDELATVENALEKIAAKNTAADGSVFLFAVGDGNHSLATAKAVWEEEKERLIKEGKSQAEIDESPVKYALVEIVNIYDEGLTFEPIHRVVFGCNAAEMMKALSEKLCGTLKEVADSKTLEDAVKNSNANFGFVYDDGGIKYMLMETGITELAVSKLQPALDDYLKTVDGSDIDYIHGTDEVFRLGGKDGAVSILLPPVAKDSFFETINGSGPLPRKSFSMGEADEKRFYLEVRKLFS